MNTATEPLTYSEELEVFHALKAYHRLMQQYVANSVIDTDFWQVNIRRLESAARKLGININEEPKP